MSTFEQRFEFAMSLHDSHVLDHRTAQFDALHAAHVVDWRAAQFDARCCAHVLDYKTYLRGHAQ